MYFYFRLESSYFQCEIKIINTDIFSYPCLQWVPVILELIVDSFNTLTKINILKKDFSVFVLSSLFTSENLPSLWNVCPVHSGGLNEINRQSLVATTVLLLRESHAPKSEGVASGMMGKVAWASLQTPLTWGLHRWGSHSHSPTV